MTKKDTTVKYTAVRWEDQRQKQEAAWQHYTHTPQGTVKRKPAQALMPVGLLPLTLPPESSTSNVFQSSQTPQQGTHVQLCEPSRNSSHSTYLRPERGRTLGVAFCSYGSMAEPTMIVQFDSHPVDMQSIHKQNNTKEQKKMPREQKETGAMIYILTIVFMVTVLCLCSHHTHYKLSFSKQMLIVTLINLLDHENHIHHPVNGEKRAKEGQRIKQLQSATQNSFLYSRRAGQGRASL